MSISPSLAGLKRAIEQFDANEMVRLLGRDELDSWAEDQGSALMGYALQQAAYRQVSFERVAPILDLLSGFENDAGEPPLIEIACDLNQPKAFLWLLDRKHSLNFTPSHTAWIRQTLLHPGWVEEGKLMGHLRKKVLSGKGMSCELLAMMLLTGRDLAAMEKAWKASRLDRQPAALVAQQIGDAARGWTTALAAPGVSSVQFKINQATWSYLAGKLAPADLLDAIGHGFVGPLLAASERQELNMQTPEVPVSRSSAKSRI